MRAKSSNDCTLENDLSPAFRRIHRHKSGRQSSTGNAATATHAHPDGVTTRSRTRSRHPAACRSAYDRSHTPGGEDFSHRVHQACENIGAVHFPCPEMMRYSAAYSCTM